MAKKKTAETANIKAAPVLRADDGGGQDPSKTKSYCIRDDWKDINKVNYVAFKSVDGEVQDLTVNGEPAGGGGGTTAEVTFVNNTNNEVEIAIPFLDQSPSGYYFNTDFYAIPGTNNPIITPLYDGQTVTMIPGHTIEVSGSAALEFSGVKITGNCTITIS